MTRGKRTHTPTLEVHLLREGIIESVHHIEATVCDDRNRPLLVAGSCETSAFIRSALKPFQALAVTTTGTLKRYELTERDLAIICSSHRGTIEQSRQAFNILWRADVDPAALQCPVPFGKKSALEHTCSGKHAGMLAVCRHRNWPIETYLERTNPVQQLILSQVSELLGMPGEELIGARDDCGAPTYSMQLQQMAYLYAQLAAGNNLDLKRIARAMIYHPRAIAADGAFDTELMRLSEGVIVSKSGAEGIQCIGHLGEGMGLAIKVRDGARRAKYAIAIHLLKQLGWIAPAVSEILSESFLNIGQYIRLETCGELSML